jgi:hypothetical protein
VVHRVAPFPLHPMRHAPGAKRSKKRDRIDTVSHHPISMLLRLTGAPIVRCFSCRLQFYDWRPPSTEKHPGT